jgi:hypothetical protein
VLFLDKVEVDARIARDLTTEGDVSVARADVANTFKPRKVGSKFTWDGQALDFPKIEGGLAGGEIAASYHVAILPKPAFTLTASLTDVQLKKLFAEANLDPGRTQGRLRGTLNLSGDPRTSEPTVGEGHFELLEAKLKPVDFLAKIGELFQIDELQLLQLKDARLDFTVRDENVWVDTLNLMSENLILRGKGQVRFNRKMNIDAELLVNRKLQQQLKGVLGKNFVASEDPEYRKLPFTVNGRLDSPKTDLIGKLIGVKIDGEMGGFLKGLFRQVAPKESEDSGN